MLGITKLAWKQSGLRFSALTIYGKLELAPAQVPTHMQHDPFSRPAMGYALLHNHKRVGWAPDLASATQTMLVYINAEIDKKQATRGVT